MTSVPSAKAKWYYNIWFVLLMLFLVLGPLGLPLVWKNPHFSRWVKGALTLIMVVYTLVLVDATVRAVKAVLNEANQVNSSLHL